MASSRRCSVAPQFLRQIAHRANAFSSDRGDSGMCPFATGVTSSVHKFASISVSGVIGFPSTLASQLSRFLPSRFLVIPILSPTRLAR